jgi:hypothetical protein
MSNNVTLKVALADSVRRITIPRTSTWRDLLQQLSLLFQIPNTSGLTLRYKDEDGDEITVSSDIELAGLLQDSRTELIKFDVLIPGYKPRPPSPEPLAMPMAPDTDETAPTPSQETRDFEHSFEHHMAQFEKHIREAGKVFESQMRAAGGAVSVEYGKFREKNPQFINSVQDASQRVVNEVKHVFDELFGQGPRQETIVPIGGASVVQPPVPRAPETEAAPYHVTVDDLESKMQTLNDMGFTNTEANQDLLQQYGGDVGQVVEVLTAQQELEQQYQH